MKAKESHLTQQMLMTAFEYNKSEGALYWKRFSGGLYLGLERAGCKTTGGYIHIEIDGEAYLEHRLIWVYFNGAWPIDQIDHINKDRMDNRIENLRQVSNSENQRNTKIRKSNRTGIMGVHVRSDNGKWSARINGNGKRYTLGSYDDFFEACCARKSAEARFGYYEGHGQ